MNSKGSNKNILKKNRLSAINNNSFPNQNKNSKQRKLMSSGNDSSKDTEIATRYRKTSATCSVNEFGNNDFEKAGSSSASFPGLNTITKTSTGVVCSPSNHFEDSSNNDSKELFLRTRHGTMKALSDYESGDSIDQSEESFLNLSWSNQNINNPITSRNNADLDSSGENDSVYEIIRSKNKTPLNLLSTSDSSDSDIPIRQQRFRKRKRIKTSSEDSDDENLSVAQSRRRVRLNNPPRTNRSVESLKSRNQMTRQLRPKINNQGKYKETESDSSGDEVISFDVSNYYATINIGSNNQQENLAEGSSSYDELNRRRHSASNEINAEPTNQNSRLPGSRLLRSRNNLLEVQRTLALEVEGETSSDDNSWFDRLKRRKRSNRVISFAQTDFNSSDSDSFTCLLFRPRRVSGGSVRIHYSDSDSNHEQTLPATVNSSAKCDLHAQPKPLNSSIQDVNSPDSDSESEKCPICFNCFGSKEVASPASCDHIFCTSCIQEWAKSSNTCPIDRKLFNKIMVRSSFNREVVLEIPVETPQVVTTWGENDALNNLISIFTSSSEEEEEEEEICCICYTSNNSQNLIICDFCSNVYHMNCLTPPLRYVPASDWFCPPCTDLEMDLD